jgi:hypothetical protein
MRARRSWLLSCCADVGPLAERFWLRDVDRRASGEPAKKAKMAPATQDTDGAAEQNSNAGGDGGKTEQTGRAEEGEALHAGDTPLPVGMQGNVLVFGFVLCSWSVEFGRETIYDDQGKVEKQIVGPMFSLHPAGPQFRWYTINKRRKSFSHPRRCLEHLAQCLDDKLRMGGGPQKQAKAQILKRQYIVALCSPYTGTELTFENTNLPKP